MIKNVTKLRKSVVYFIIINDYKVKKGRGSVLVGVSLRRYLSMWKPNSVSHLTDSACSVELASNNLV